MFGDDDGRRLTAWIEANYEVVERIQEPVPGGVVPFAAILRRKPR